MKTRHRPLSPEPGPSQETKALIRQIRRMSETGMSAEQISDALDVNEAGIHRLLQSHAPPPARRRAADPQQATLDGLER